MKPRAAATAYDVSPADLGTDRAEIIAFCSSMLRGFTAVRYEKYFERNPFGRPIVVTARTATNGELVGVAALHPQHMRVEGEILAAGIAGDFAVDPQHRAFGPALALQRELTRAGSARGLGLALGIPIDAAAGVFRRVGYSRVGTFVRLTCVLRLPGHAREIARRSVPPRALAASMRTRPLRDALEGHAVLEPDSFDAPLDSLLTEIEPIGISVDRSSEYLNWRFELHHGATRSPFSILALTRAGAPVAYAVSRDDQRVRHVVDLAWLDKPGLAAVVAAVVEQSHDAGLVAVHILCFGGAASLAAELSPIGFFPAPEPGRAVWSRGGNPDAVADPARWLLFESAFDE